LFREIQAASAHDQFTVTMSYLEARAGSRVVTDSN
jgi:hypothetical protein